MSYRRECRECGTVIYSTEERPLCGNCKAGYRPMSKKNWHTIALIGWAVVVFSPLMCFGFSIASDQPAGPNLIEVSRAFNTTPDTIWSVLMGLMFLLFFAGLVAIFVGYIGRARAD